MFHFDVFVLPNDVIFVWSLQILSCNLSIILDGAKWILGCSSNFLRPVMRQLEETWTHCRAAGIEQS